MYRDSIPIPFCSLSDILRRSNYNRSNSDNSDSIDSEITTRTQYDNDPPTIGSEYLPDSVFLHVMTFVDPCTLYNCHLLSKKHYYSNFIPIQIAIEVSLMQGGRAKNVVDALYPQMKSGSIHPISSKRLLSLIISKKCEFCLNARRFQNNNSVTVPREPYAINICWRCATSRRKTVPILKSGNRFRLNPWPYHVVLDHSRSATKKFGWRIIRGNHENMEIAWARMNSIDVRNDNQTYDQLNYMLKENYVDSRGEPSGPILSYNDAVEIIVQLNDCQSLDEIKYKFDEFLNEKRRVLSIHSPSYRNFVESYELIIDHANWKECEKKHKQKLSSEDWKFMKMDKARRLIQKVRSAITDHDKLPLLDYTMNMGYMICSKNRRPRRLRTPLFMNRYWVDQIMREAINFPSKYNSARKISNLAYQLEHYNMDEDDDPRRSWKLKVLNREIIYMSIFIQTTVYLDSGPDGVGCLDNEAG
eukprot:scaffold219381_cov70-Cyclotella_meneghiniana.AAC.2